MMDDERQMDLIDWLADAPSNQVAKCNTPSVLTSRFTQWEILLANSTAAGRIRIIVSARWEQKCLERLVDPDNKQIGHRILWHTGAISRYPVPPGAKPLRCIHMTHDAVLKLQGQWPLVQEYRDPNYAWLRLAEPGEPGSETLDTPTQLYFGS